MNKFFDFHVTFVTRCYEIIYLDKLFPRTVRKFYNTIQLQNYPFDLYDLNVSKSRVNWHFSCFGTSLIGFYMTYAFHLCFPLFLVSRMEWIPIKKDQLKVEIQYFGWKFCLKFWARNCNLLLEISVSPDFCITRNNATGCFYALSFRSGKSFIYFQSRVIMACETFRLYFLRFSFWVNHKSQCKKYVFSY